MKRWRWRRVGVAVIALVAGATLLAACSTPPGSATLNATYACNYQAQVSAGTTLGSVANNTIPVELIHSTGLFTALPGWIELLERRNHLADGAGQKLPAGTITIPVSCKNSKTSTSH